MTEMHDHHPETQLSGRLRALSDSACSRVGAAQHTAARREHVRVLRLSPWCPPRRPRSRAGAQGRSALIQTVALSSRNPSHRTHACTLEPHLFPSGYRTTQGNARRARRCATPLPGAHRGGPWPRARAQAVARWTIVQKPISLDAFVHSRTPSVPEWVLYSTGQLSMATSVHLRYELVPRTVSRYPAPAPLR